MKHKTIAAMFVAALALNVCTVVSAALLSYDHQRKSVVRSTPIFIFHSDEFWLNLHHFLYVLGRAANKTRDASREAVFNAPADQDNGLAGLEPDEQKTWRDGVAAYATGISRKDLVFDEPLPTITSALVRAGHADTLGSEIDPAAAAILTRVAPVYRKGWWSKHQAANKAWQTEIESLSSKFGSEVLSFITKSYQMEWPVAGYDVHIVAYSNWAGAYSTTGNLLVLSSRAPNLKQEYGLETVFHEGMHQWDDQVSQALREQAQKIGKPVPGDLSHGLIFFTAGEAVRRVLPRHVPYAYKSGVWQRRNPAEREALEAIWKPYLDGHGTRDDALAGLIRRLAPDIKSYMQEARDAYKAKDYPALIEAMKNALAMRPNYGPFIYNIGAGYALSGNKTDAIYWLNRLADMGLVYTIEKDADFAQIKDTDEFKAVIKRFEDNAKPIGNSTTAFTVHERGLVPEGIAYDPVEKTFYLGSVYKRKIVSINSAGEAKDFSSESDGLWSVMGMRVDPARRLLWVCTASHSQMINFKESERGVSGIFKYDLETKRLIGKYLLPSQPKPHWLGDLVLNSSGDVFASDSVTPAIYVIDHNKDRLDPFLENEAFVNLQGLAFSADEQRMFLADYLKGIYVIDMKTKAASLLTPASRTTMLGIDGLYYYRGKLIGVQNGVSPNRLVTVSLNDAATEVKAFDVLEANNPAFDEPTLAVISADSLFYIANSQWRLIDDKGKLAADEKLRDPIVLKLKL